MCLSDLSKLGGGINGVQPTLIGGGKASSGMIGSSSRGRFRFVLREAFGNGCLFNQIAIKNTPFRMATNSGDPNGTINKGPSLHLPQVNGVGGIQGVRTRSRMTIGGVHNNEDAYYSGNPKYVYDSSNYTKFRKLQAINRNYNDKSFGGNMYSASQVALSRVRH